MYEIEYEYERYAVSVYREPEGFVACVLRERNPDLPHEVFRGRGYGCTDRAAMQSLCYDIGRTAHITVMMAPTG